MTTRLTACLLALAVVLGGVLLLRPSESTLAAWSDEATVTVPQLRTGGVRVDVAGATAASATLGMSGDTSGTWRPGAVTVTSAGRVLTGAELAGSRVDYRLARNGVCAATEPVLYSATPSGTASSFAVTGGERLSGARTLCLTFVPSDHVRLQLGGRSLSFATTVGGVATASSTWTATNTWTATQQLPAAPSVTAPQCSSSWPRVTLRWEWDRAGMVQDVTRWSVQAEAESGWREINSLNPSQRSTGVSSRDFPPFQFENTQVRVVAVLADGTTVTSATTTVRVERLVVLGAVYCA